MSDNLDYDTSISGATGRTFDPLSFARSLWQIFGLHYRLLVLLIPLFFAFALVMIANSTPTYTATAVLGPTTTLSEPNAGGNLQGLARRFGGGMFGQGGMSDTFNEFTALLSSNRLAGELAANPTIMHEVFWQQWDAGNNRWRENTGFLGRSIDALKILVGRPTKAVPDQDDLQKYLDSSMQSTVSLETGYATVTLHFRGREESVRLLAEILKKADDIIREDRRRDVAARIAYLRNALEDLTITTEKDALIQTLSDQEQTMMIISSDKRYASTFIDGPYAPVRPTSPNPYSDVLAFLLLAVGTWFVIAYFAPVDGRIHKSLEWLGGRRSKMQAIPTQTRPTMAAPIQTTQASLPK
ncbi:MAG: hypothetical protein ACREGR_00500 [Minisyncoccia bacterium]